MKILWVKTDFLHPTTRGGQPWTGTPGPTTTTQPLSLARYPGAEPMAYLSGTLDEVRAYDRALTEEEILALAQ